MTIRVMQGALVLTADLDAYTPQLARKLFTMEFRDPAIALREALVAALTAFASAIEEEGVQGPLTAGFELTPDFIQHPAPPAELD